MRVSVNSKGCKDLFSFSQDNKIQNQVRPSDIEINAIAIHSYHTTSLQNTLQTANNAILRLVQSIEMINKSVSVDEFQNQNVTLEQAITKLIESMNETLSIINKVSDNFEIASNKNNNTTQDSLRKLQEMIITIFKDPEIMGEEVSADLSSFGIKLMKDGSIDINQKALKEAIILDNKEVTKAIKSVVTSLFEKMPLYIDPNSGNLINIRRKIDKESDNNTSKITAALKEKLEKERTELIKKLNLTDLLMVHSGNFIESLKLSAEILDVKELDR